MSDIIYFLCALFLVVSAQFLPYPERSDFETTINEYRFQFHDEFHVLLVMHGRNCYVSDVPEGSILERDMLDQNTTRTTFVKIIPLVESGEWSSRTELEKVNSRYNDQLIRALCFTKDMYTLDLHTL